MTQLLEGKRAIIYGAGGGIGSGVARTFAREGATVFLAGRTKATLQTGADQAGGIDVSFNLTNRGDAQGTPLVAMKADDLLRAVDNGLRSNFITARAAARHMVAQKSGVILHLNSASGEGAMPGMGSTGPADAATESFMRYLAAEMGPQGIRVCGIWTAGVVETLTKEKLAAVGGE